MTVGARPASLHKAGAPRTATLRPSSRTCPVAKRGDHQASLSIVNRDVMREAIGFACGPVGRLRQYGALSDEVRGGVVLVQVREDRSQRFARVQLLRRPRILGVHIHDEVGVWGKECHLAFRIAAVGAICVGFDEFSDREAIGSFLR